MKYTEKQIKKAFLKWETFNRLNPSKVMTDEVFKNMDVEETAEANTQQLINYINE